jgi:hypothetical protein
MIYLEAFQENVDSSGATVGWGLGIIEVILSTIFII